TRGIQPVGTEVRFELRIANDTIVLGGLGRVKTVREPDPTKPRAAFGMGIELLRVTREGRELIMRMIERRRAMGLPDVAIPVPEDLESAKRADVETQPRAEVSSIVREGLPRMASEPVAEQVLVGQPSRPSGPETGPVGRARPTPVPA